MGDRAIAESTPTVGKQTRTSELDAAASEESLWEDLDEEGNVIGARAYSPGALPDAGTKSALPTGTTATTLKGTFGVYEISSEFLQVGAKRTWALRCTIEMTPNSMATGKRIGWVQVVRRHDHDTGNWATKRGKHNGMDATREKRTDPKSGFRVDRRSRERSPFYGTDRGTDNTLIPEDNMRFGSRGGPKPWMRDTPQVNPVDQVEFIATPTDVETGAQYDAIGWGFQVDVAGGLFVVDPPKIVQAGSLEMAGRDRAIHKWNTEVDGVDGVPMAADPVAVANRLSQLLSGRDVEGLKRVLMGVKEPDLRKRVQECYRVEHGRTLASDLAKQIAPTERKQFKGWV